MLTNGVKISKKKSKSKLTFVKNFALKVVKMNMQNSQNFNSRYIDA